MSISDTQSVAPTEITFASRGVTCAGWHVRATSPSLTTAAGRPCVVMAHGFGGTRDSGLLPYANEFATAGIDSFVFDYRGWGASEGAPRQDVNCKRQRQDYHAALDAARRLPGVDASRIALWGTSYSAGHAIAVAAQRRDRGDKPVGIVALTPAVDGIGAVSSIARHAGIGQLCWATREGLRDTIKATRGQQPHTIPIIGSPGSRAVMTAPGALETFAKIAGPTALNEVAARHMLAVARNRPIIYASKLRCPVLVQIGTDDHVAPPSIARRLARKLGNRATVLTYPVDHFDVYDEPWRDPICTDQVTFLTQLFSGDNT